MGFYPSCENGWQLASRIDYMYHVFCDCELGKKHILSKKSVSLPTQMGFVFFNCNRNTVHCVFNDWHINMQQAMEYIVNFTVEVGRKMTDLGKITSKLKCLSCCEIQGVSFILGNKLICFPLLSFRIQLVRHSHVKPLVRF